MRNPPEICAKCRAQTIAMGDVAARTIDDIRVSTYKDPTAILFRGEKSVKLVAAICLTCGYTELYAENPGELVQPPA